MRIRRHSKWMREGFATGSARERAAKEFFFRWLSFARLTHRAKLSLFAVLSLALTWPPRDAGGARSAHRDLGHRRSWRERKK